MRKLRAIGRYDLLALAIVLAYLWVARSTSGGGTADPVWQAAHDRGELLVGTDAGYRPFADQQGERYTGYDVELVEELGRRLGLRVRFVNVGYDALYEALSGGRAHLIAAGLPLAPGEGWRARFSDPYLDAGLRLLVPRGSPIAGPADLRGRRVVVELGSSADVEARRLRRSLGDLQLLSSAQSSDEVLELLLAGQADASILDGPSALAALNTRPQLLAVASLSYEPYVLAMPASAYKLQEQLNLHLAQLRAEGFFDRQNARWFR